MYPQPRQEKNRGEMQAHVGAGLERAVEGAAGATLYRDRHLISRRNCRAGSVLDGFSTVLRPHNKVADP
jgi:hypothetical protein